MNGDECLSLCLSHTSPPPTTTTTTTTQHTSLVINGGGKEILQEIKGAYSDDEDIVANVESALTSITVLESRAFKSELPKEVSQAESLMLMAAKLGEDEDDDNWKGPSLHDAKALVEGGAFVKCIPPASQAWAKKRHIYYQNGLLCWKKQGGNQQNKDRMPVHQIKKIEIDSSTRKMLKVTARNKYFLQVFFPSEEVTEQWRAALDVMWRNSN